MSNNSEHQPTTLKSLWKDFLEAFDLNKGYCVTVSGLTDYTLEKRYNPNSVIGIRNLISEYEQYDQMDSVEKSVFWELMVRVDSVIPNSPAYKAGIQIGDIVTKNQWGYNQQ